MLRYHYAIHIVFGSRGLNIYCRCSWNNMPMAVLVIPKEDKIVSRLFKQSAGMRAHSPDIFGAEGLHQNFHSLLHVLRKKLVYELKLASEQSFM
jgi:hypothetical protein